MEPDRTRQFGVNNPGVVKYFRFAAGKTILGGNQVNQMKITTPIDILETALLLNYIVNI